MRKLWIGLWFGIVGLPVPANATVTCQNVALQIVPDRDASRDRQQIWTDLALYMLTGLSPDRSCTTNELMLVNCDTLTWSDCSELATPQTYFQIREQYQALQLQSIPVRQHDAYVPPTVSEMSAATDYKSWEREIVAPSRVKLKTRVIYRSPTNFPLRMSVAETYNTDTEDLTAPRLETELALRRNDGNYDFYAYNAAGQLVDYSQFPSGPKPAPTICISCHYESATRKVSRYIPD
jgi:hypothetical protein